MDLNRALGALVMTCLTAGAAVAWAGTAEPGAQPVRGAHRPEAAGRVVRVFDFEERGDPERPDFNPEPVPRHWVRAQHNPPERERPGFPLGNKAGYDLETAHGGAVSVVLPTLGGSTALRLAPALLPVFPSTDYSVRAWARVEGLSHARGFLTAQFTDAKGEPVEGSRGWSAPIGGEQGGAAPEGGGWREVVVNLPGRWPGAAFVQVELLLLQPEQFQPAPVSGSHHVWSEDYTGSVWFDDVQVMQMPRVELRASTPAGVSGGRGPGFSVNVQDLTGEAIEGTLTIRDVDDVVVASLTRNLGAGGGRLDWAPSLPGLGWYGAELELRSGGAVLARKTCAAVWSPGGPSGGGRTEDRSRRARGRFTLIVEGLDPSQDAYLGALAEAAWCGRVVVALPESGGGQGGPSRLDRLRAQVDPLLRGNVEVEVWMPRVPEDLAASLRIDPGDPLALLELPPASWMPGLRDVLDVFGQRVQRWSIGSGRDHATLMRGDLASRVATVRAGLARSIPGPVVVLPWRADWAWPEGVAGAKSAADALTIELPSGLPLEAVSALSREWAEKRRGGGGGVSVVIEPLDAERFGRRAAAEEMVKRAALVWEGLDPWRAPGAGPRDVGLAIRQPFRRAESAGSAFQPEATLAAWRTIVERLGPRRVAGRLPGSPGVTCLVLVDAEPGGAAGAGGPSRGSLLVWSDGSDADAHVTAYLGEGPLRVVDVFGNERALEGGRAGSPQRVAAGVSPVFVEGINEQLALFIEGLSLEPSFVNAVASEHEHWLAVTNPWPVRLTGEVQLAAPEGSRAKSSWRFSPTAPMPIVLGPGERVRLPVTFSFSAAEEAGPTALRAIVRLNAGRAYPAMSLGVPITIGLRDLDLGASVILSPTEAGPDVVVTATVSNTGSRARTMQVETTAGGEASQQQPVSNLGAGETVVRRFVFKDAAGRLSGRRVRVTLVDAEGAERLNRSVVVP